MLLGSCGGEDGGTPSPTPAPSATVSPTPSPGATGACTLRSRQDWVLNQLNEWYLFPSLLDSAANPASYSTLESYTDALVAPARARNQDRFFTYVTSLKEEIAFYENGATAGFGFRLGYDSGARRLFITESFENSPAFGANIDRGDEIIAAGSSPATLQNVATMSSSTLGTLFADSEPGTRLTVRVRGRNGPEREVTLASANFAMMPVSNRYGAKIFEQGGRKIGYLNLRSFIEPAHTELRRAFADFRARSVTELIVDLRYNGGGLINTARLLTDLMGGGRNGQVQGRVSFRESKSANDEVYNFIAQPESIQPMKIAFIGTGATASASELVMNAFIPYLGPNIALIGTNTFGKPVGQIALDQPGCDDRLRAVALRFVNASGQGDYYSGMAGIMPNTCRAYDDISQPLGSENEEMIRTALNFLAGGSCSPITITGTATGSAARITGTSGPLPSPEGKAGTFQREVPGAF